MTASFFPDFPDVVVTFEEVVEPLSSLISSDEASSSSSAETSETEVVPAITVVVSSEV